LPEHEQEQARPGCVRARRRAGGLNLRAGQRAPQLAAVADLDRLAVLVQREIFGPKPGHRLAAGKHPHQDLLVDHLDPLVDPLLGRQYGKQGYERRE